MPVRASRAVALAAMALLAAKMPSPTRAQTMADDECIEAGRYLCYLCQPADGAAASQSRECVRFSEVGDGTEDYPQGDDESMIAIGFCPPRYVETGAIKYYTFRTDMGKDYATVHRQQSAATRPCQFPFELDGTSYNECVKHRVNDADGNALFGTDSEDTAQPWCIAYSSDSSAQEPVACTDLCSAVSAYCCMHPGGSRPRPWRRRRLFLSRLRS
eukprot:SAG22_NODE_32_length_27675_cov_12.130119_6_plen_215_part_00